MLRLKPIFIVFTILILGLLLYQGSWAYGGEDRNPRHRKTPKVKEIPPKPAPLSPADLRTGKGADVVDWSKFAYLQYVTASQFLCCSIMIFQSLNRLKSKADRVLMYPEAWGEVGDERWMKLPEEDRKLMEKAKDKFKVKLRPVGIIHAAGAESMSPHIAPPRKPSRY